MCRRIQSWTALIQLQDTSTALCTWRRRLLTPASAPLPSLCLSPSPPPPLRPAARKSILCDDLNLKKSHWEGVSEEAKSFIALLLNKDPSNRPSAKEALRHPWLAGPGPEERGVGRALGLAVVQRIQRYGASSLFKRSVLQHIAGELLSQPEGRGEPERSVPLGEDARPLIVDPKVRARGEGGGGEGQALAPGGGLEGIWCWKLDFSREDGMPPWRLSPEFEVGFHLPILPQRLYWTESPPPHKRPPAGVAPGVSVRAAEPGGEGSRRPPGAGRGPRRAG